MPLACLPSPTSSPVTEIEDPEALLHALVLGGPRPRRQVNASWEAIAELCDAGYATWCRPGGVDTLFASESGRAAAETFAAARESIDGRVDDVPEGPFDLFRSVVHNGNEMVPAYALLLEIAKRGEIRVKPEHGPALLELRGGRPETGLVNVSFGVAKILPKGTELAAALERLISAVRQGASFEQIRRDQVLLDAVRFLVKRTRQVDPAGNTDTRSEG